MLLTAAASGLTAGLLMFHLRRFMALLPAVMVLLLGVANLTGSLLARPHVLAWPCLELPCAGLVLARFRGTRPSWWLLPVMIVWVNLHGSFMLGLLLPLVFLVEAAFEAGPRWRQAAADWAVFILAAWACALLNPDGVSGLLFPFRLLGMANLDWIGEWQPADFAAFRPLELTILVLLGVGLMGRLRVPPLRLLMLLGLVHMALRHWRHDQLLGLLGPLLLAEAIGRMTPAPEATSTDPSAGETVPALRAVTPLKRAAPPVGMAFFTAIAVIARLAMPLDHEPGAGVLAALDTVPAALRAKPVLNDYGFGAGLIAHGDRPFIDSRADLYGGAFLGRFRDITELHPGALDAAMRDFDIAWTIFPPDAALLPKLDRRAGSASFADHARRGHPRARRRGSPVTAVIASVRRTTSLGRLLTIPRVRDTSRVPHLRARWARRACCPGGGIGRRAGFRDPWPQGRESSSSFLGTTGTIPTFEGTTQFMVERVSIHLHRHDLPDGIDLGPVIAVDTETMGLNPHRDRLCLVQMSAGDGHAHLVQLVPTRLGGHGFDCPNLKHLMADPDVVKLMHFARFDVAVLQHSPGTSPSAPVRCTKIAAKLVRTFTDKHGLKDLCKELLGVDLSKQQQTSDWGAVELTPEQCAYAASDCAPPACAVGPVGGAAGARGIASDTR